MPYLPFGRLGAVLDLGELTKREQYHSNILMTSVSLFEQATRTKIEKLTQYFMTHGVTDPGDASRRAFVAVGKIVQKQAYIFSDMFFLLGVALIVALAASLLQETRPSHGGQCTGSSERTPRPIKPAAACSKIRQNMVG
jgi:DHA2 family multidrug resistance protein